MEAIRNYTNELTSSIASRWNRFWFTPDDPVAVCAMRALVGLAAVYFLISHSADLIVWFGRDGLLPIETVRQLVGSSPDSPSGFRWSYLFFTDAASSLWAVHLVGIGVAIAFALGLFSRVTSVLTLLTVLAYVHRAPMITGPFEPILTMLLFYLCLAPSGAVFSLDQIIARCRARRSAEMRVKVDHRANDSLAANISLRMMQVHVCLFYLMMGLTKLAGEPWWRGDAIWWLAASSESRWWDVTFLHRYPLLINVWTHAVVAFELSFPVLIWHRLVRPLLLSVGLAMWPLLAVVSGQVSFCCIMLIANLCFLPSPTWRAVTVVAARAQQP
jgi:hypothetical protein